MNKSLELCLKALNGRACRGVFIHTGSGCEERFEGKFLVTDERRSYICSEHSRLNGYNCEAARSAMTSYAWEVTFSDNYEGMYHRQIYPILTSMGFIMHTQGIAIPSFCVKIGGEYLDIRYYFLKYNKTLTLYDLL